MNKDHEEKFKELAKKTRKALSCIFCSHPFIKSGTLNFPGSNKKEKLKVCAKCNLPITEKDMELILRWERETGKDVYQKKADWKGIKRHFKLHKQLTSRTKKDE